MEQSSLEQHQIHLGEGQTQKFILGENTAEELLKIHLTSYTEWNKKKSYSCSID